MEIHINSKVIIVDDNIEDKILRGYKWFILTGRGNSIYVASGNSRIGITMMHRLIAGSPPKSLVVDHINGNTLDNRSENLRVITQKQNTWNRKVQGGKCPNKTGYIGTFFNKKRGKWFSAISHDNKSLYLGTFDSILDAAIAYDKKCLELRGEFAKLNFPLS